MKFIILVVFISVSAGVFSQSAFKSGMRAFENKDYPSAVRYFGECIKNSPKSPDAYYQRALVFYSIKQYDRALDDIDSAIKRYTRRFAKTPCELYNSRADIYIAMDDTAKAVAEYTNSLKFDPYDFNTLNNRAYIYTLQKDYDSSDNDYKMVLDKDPTNQYAMLGIAINLYCRKRYKESEELIMKAAKINSSFPDLYRYLALVYFEEDKNNEAVDCVMKYFTLSPEPEYYVLQDCVERSFAYTMTRMMSFVTSEPYNCKWASLRAHMYKYKEKWSDALSDYVKVGELLGYEEMDVTLNKGLCFMGMGKYNEAIKEFTKVIENEPCYLAYLNRGEVYRMTGDYPMALKDFTAAIGFKPSQAHYVYTRIAGTKIAAGDYNGAMDDCISALDINKNYIPAYIMRGDLYFVKGEDSKASKDYERVLMLDTVADAGSLRQFALASLGRGGEAIAWNDSVYNNSARNVKWYYYNTALLYVRVGDNAKALANLEKALNSGFNDFGYLKTDKGLDPLREEPGYISLVSRYEDVESRSVKSFSGEEYYVTTEIPMERRRGTYEVPCNINGMTMTMIFDTGASTISLSLVEARFMIKNGYLSKSDFVGRAYSTIADGSVSINSIVILRNVKIGDFELKNVKAVIEDSERMTVPVLLGQSVLSKFGKVEIDYENSKIIITQKRYR